MRNGNTEVEAMWQGVLEKRKIYLLRALLREGFLDVVPNMSLKEG